MPPYINNCTGTYCELSKSFIEQAPHGSLMLGALLVLIAVTLTLAIKFSERDSMKHGVDDD